MTGARVAVLLLLAATTGALGLVDATAEVAQGETRCAAADALRDDGQFDLAEGQYKKALDDPQERTCAVAGLKQLEVKKQAAADKKKDDDRVVDSGDAYDAVVDWLAKAWPWIAVFVVLSALGWLFRLLRPSKHIAIRAAKADAKFADAVVAAASAAGGDGSPSPSVKVVLAGADALPAKTITDVSKLLSLPGSVPLAPLLKLAAFPLAPSTLSVGWSAAGGWAVAELRLRRAWRRRRKARVALKLGSLDATKQQEAVALVVGAWIVGFLPHRRSLWKVLMLEPKPTTTTQRGDMPAVLAHAYFRAGANLQLRGEAPTALRCYEAMPLVAADVAPFAWVGSRLNAMMVLKAQKRIDEADAMAHAVAGVAHDILDDAEYRDRFGDDQLRDLRRRTVYLTAILRVDLLAEDPSDEDRKDAAREAVALLTEEITGASDPEAHVDLGLLTAMKMVKICHAVLDDSSANPPADPAATLEAGLQAAANASPRQPLGAAAYYDAACAYNLMAIRSDPPSEANIVNALDMLKLAAAATPASSRARMLATARSDAMLAFLREQRKPQFDGALGVVETPGPDASLAVSVTNVPAAVAD
jgi:hypothetical protein